MSFLFFELSPGAEAAFVEGCDTPARYVAQHVLDHYLMGIDNYIETTHKIQGGKNVIIATDPLMMGVSVVCLREEMA
jgi:hypothetical protein